jgi:hypothetical protein
MRSYLDQLLGSLELTSAQWEYMRGIRPLPLSVPPDAPSSSAATDESSISQEELDNLLRRQMITPRSPARRNDYYVTALGAGIVGAVLNQLEGGESHGMDRTPPTSGRFERDAPEPADGCSSE